MHLYIYVADVDDVVRRAIAAGAKVIDQVEDRDWGDRCGGIEDPYGHVWFVGTPLKDLAPKSLGWCTMRRNLTSSLPSPQARTPFPLPWSGRG